MPENNDAIRSKTDLEKRIAQGRLIRLKENFAHHVSETYDYLTARFFVEGENDMSDCWGGHRDSLNELLMTLTLCAGWCDSLDSPLPRTDAALVTALAEVYAAKVQLVADYKASIAADMVLQ